MALGSTALGLPLLAFGAQAHGAAQQSRSSADAAAQQKRKLGIALVGLGNYSTNQLAPALRQPKLCHLAGIVTGTPAKAVAWQKKYGIPEKNSYTYETMDQVANNPDIDVIYIVLPNGMHAEYTIKAAEAGKHVICEKPMATSVADCERMIDACKRNKVHLSIGYRLHYEPHHQQVMELGQQQLFGPVQKIEAADSFVIGDPDVWRLDKKLAGGGPLMDLGIYCVQAALYTTGELPNAITARFGEVTRPRYFDEVEQSISWQMEFPGGAIADCTTSYDKNENLLYGQAAKGWWRLQPAYSYTGITGKTSEGKMNYPQVNQQARQMDGIAQNILENRESRVPGEMGLRDVRLLTAIYEAAKTGKRITVG